MTETDCPFCEIAAGRAPAKILRDTGGTLTIEPLLPVTRGHVLILPRRHVPDAATDPATTALVFGHAATWAAGVGPCNLITSVGVEATQSIMHLHAHVVPRRAGDDLMLPWSTWKP